MSSVRHGRAYLAWLSAVIVACGGTSRAVVSASSEDTDVAVGLRLSEAPSEGSVPQTRIVLVVIDPSLGRATAPVGVFAGPCVHDTPMPEAIVTARCWWAEDEATISVVRDGDNVRSEGQSKFRTRNGWPRHLTPGIDGSVGCSDRPRARPVGAPGARQGASCVGRFQAPWHAIGAAVCLDALHRRPQ